MKRRGTAVWRGGLKDGSGTVSTETDALAELPYSFAARFENGAGTNPEELIGAAHAGCYSMALSGILGESHMKPDSIATTATVTLEKTDAGFTVTAVHLDVVGTVPGMDPVAFQAAAEKAKIGCPISRLLNAKITLDATLR